MRSGYPFPTDEIDPWTNQGDNLAWVAFRYVADELAPDLADQFERRLLDDQGAREAGSLRRRHPRRLRDRCPRPILFCGAGRGRHCLAVDPDLANPLVDSPRVWRPRSCWA